MNNSFIFIGQASVLLKINGLVILVDPYFFDSVFEKYGPEFKRQYPFPSESINLSKIDYVFITHEHLDHADPASIEKLIRLNSDIHIICPESVWVIFKKNKLIRKSIHVLSSNYLILNNSLKVNVIPAAHTKLFKNKNGFPANVGYLFEYHKQFIYHSGDTIPHPEIISAVTSIGKPDIAFLPCNERNYYREMRGIVGNMSVREMFQFGEDIKSKRVCPIHWDMFKFNSVFPEEIKLLHSLLKSSVNLTIPQHGVYYDI